MSDAIARIKARRVWDSRGRPTLEAEVTLDGGAVGRAIAPAGASRGSREAVDLRDGGARFGGMDVLSAVANVDGPIARALVGRDARDQAGADAALIALDGTPNKARLGGNATVAVSLAVAHAAAAASRSAVVAISRRRRSGLAAAAGNPDLRRRRARRPAHRSPGPDGDAGRRRQSFDEALAMTADVYRAAGELMRDAGKLAGVADEGGWWPAFGSNEEALAMLVRAIERAGFVPGDEVAISLDVAASEFGRDGRYRLGLDRRELDRDGMIELLLGLARSLPDRLDRGSARRGRPRRVDRLRASGRRARPDRR